MYYASVYLVKASELIITKDVVEVDVIPFVFFGN